MTEALGARRVRDRGARPRCGARGAAGHPEGRADPYPHYARIREHTPVFRSADGQLDRHPLRRLPTGAAGPALRQGCRPRRHGSPAPGPMGDPGRGGRRTSSSSSSGGSPSSRSTRPTTPACRGLVARAFTPNTVEALRPHVVALCDGLLDTLADLAERRNQRRRDGRARLPLPCSRDR